MTEEPQEYPDEPVEDFSDEAADSYDEESAPEEPVETPAAVATGHPAVDEVLRSLDALTGAPVDEHVAVFEQAHDQLRRTLSGAGDDQA